jgi:hypothetical protein
MTRRAREHYPVAMIQVRHFIPWAKIAGSLLILTGGATACVTGLNPLLRGKPWLTQLDSVSLPLQYFRIFILHSNASCRVAD